MKLVGTAVGLLALGTGCASLQEDFQNQYCNKNGGYERGMNDARKANAMDDSFARACTLETSDAARGGYREGYSAGLASRASEAAVATPTTLINVNIGQDREHSYYCEVHAFTDKFEGWGTTELAAQLDAKNRCERQYHEMHCKDFTCRH